MGVLNMDLWETLDEELGYPTEYTPGIMGVVLDEEAMDVLRQEHEANIRRGVDVRLLDLPAIKEMAPLITDRVVGGIFWPRAATPTLNAPFRRTRGPSRTREGASTRTRRSRTSL